MIRTSMFPTSAAAALLAIPVPPAQAEVLKFAHVYEVSEPYHKWALSAA